MFIDKRYYDSLEICFDLAFRFLRGDRKKLNQIHEFHDHVCTQMLKEVKKADMIKSLDGIENDIRTALTNIRK